MVYVVYLNPTIERIVRKSHHHPARPCDMIEEYAGKGIKVAQTLGATGVDVAVIGLKYSMDDVIAGKLFRGEVPAFFVECEGRPATSIKIIGDDGVKESTQEGTPVKREDLKRFEEILFERVKPMDVVVFEGSVPPGVDENYFSDLMKQIKCNVVVDTEAYSLKQCLKHRPMLIKPNVEELEVLCKGKFLSDYDILRISDALMEEGAKYVCVSQRGQGAIMTDGKKAFRALPLKLVVRSKKGAGECMVAGILNGLINGLSTRDALALGSAAAAASVSLPTGETIYKELIYEMLSKITVLEV